MRGSINWQVKQIWKQIDKIGTSKRESRENSGMHALSSKHNISDGVHSFEYKDEVLKTARQLGEFAKERFGVRDMQQIDRDIVREFVEAKVERGVSYRTISNQISHLAKIQTGLSRIERSMPGHERLFSREDLRELREYAHDRASRIERGPRFYANPDRIVANVDRADVALAARLQRELGLRASEAIRIRPEQFSRNPDGTGVLFVQGKGGYMLQKEVPAPLAQKLQEHLERNGQLNVRYETYREALQRAVERSGEEWHGTHGMRHSYARERMEELQKEGIEDRTEALRQVSEELGHHRPEITEVYLR